MGSPDELKWSSKGKVCPNRNSVNQEAASVMVLTVSLTVSRVSVV